jgi:cobalamin biosynthesis protein CbiD
MEQSIAQSSQYVITARGQGGIVQQTCAAAAAAVLVAMTLKEAGYTVEVQDPMGNPLSSELASDSGARDERDHNGTRSRA